MGFCVPKNRRWPGGVIYWKGGSGSEALTDAQVEMLKKGIKAWQDACNGVIRFSEKLEDGAAGCVTIKKVAGTTNSAGAIGYEGGGAVFSFGADSKLATLVHELGHILGLFHEHERPDGAAHGVVLDMIPQMMVESRRAKGKDGVAPDVGTCFRQHAQCSYDVSSIMHYKAAAWKWKAGATAVAVPGEAEAPSAGDVAAVTWLYS